MDIAAFDIRNPLGSFFKLVWHWQKKLILKLPFEDVAKSAFSRKFSNLFRSYGEPQIGGAS
jgi:hypothetical protein